MLQPICGGRSRGGERGGGVNGGSILQQIHPESPGNGVSDVPDFKIFQGSMPPDLLACHTFSSHKF